MGKFNVASDVSQSQSEPAVFRSPLWKMLLVLLGALAFVAIGIWMLLAGGPVVPAILGIGFFGFCAVLAIVRLIRRPAMLVVYADAVEDHRGRRVRFEDVEQIVLTRVSRNRFLVILARDGTPSARELEASGVIQRMNAAFLPGGERALWLPSVVVGMPLDQLAEHLSAMIPCAIVRLA